MYGDVKYSPIRVGIVNRGEWMCSEVVFPITLDFVQLSVVALANVFPKIQVQKTN